MTTLEIRLCAIDGDMAQAWAECFGQETGVRLLTGNIVEQRADALISPANSFGFMDGGIDLVYSHFFGWALEARLKTRLQADYSGELPVGNAVIVPTHHPDIPYLVSAPTMRVPSPIGSTVNVYLAFRAALLAIQAHNENHGTPIQSVLTPALGAGIGGMPPSRVARQMRAAFQEVIRGECGWKSNAKGILAHHADLLR